MIRREAGRVDTHAGNSAAEGTRKDLSTGSSTGPLCRSCNARIIWTETAETRSGGAGGRRMPVDAEPSARGNIYLDDGRVPPSEVVRFATGKGNADKAAVVEAVRERFFSGDHESADQVTDDNEADAIALLEYARAEIVEAEA